MSLLGGFRLCDSRTGERLPPNLRLVPGRDSPSDSAFFPPGRGCPLDLCAVAPVRGAATDSLLRAAPVALAAARRRAPHGRALPWRLCTTQWCDKLSLPAPENLQQEPAQIPLRCLWRTCNTRFRWDSSSFDA